MIFGNVGMPEMGIRGAALASVIAMIPIWGFATATNSLVSYLIGMKQQDEVLSLIS